MIYHLSTTSPNFLIQDYAFEFIKGRSVKVMKRTVKGFYLLNERVQLRVNVFYLESRDSYLEDQEFISRYISDVPHNFLSPLIIITINIIFLCSQTSEWHWKMQTQVRVLLPANLAEVFQVSLFHQANADMRSRQKP